MFNKIEEGLQVYKSEMEGFIKKSRTIDKRERKDREEHNLDYRGVADWLKEEREWYDKTISMLEGMKKALGLSDDERQVIWGSITEKLSTT
jgi:hypothetical protein